MAMIGPMNWVGFIPLGVGLLWAVHLSVSGKQQVTSGVVRSLQLAGSVMIILGVIGPLLWTSPLGWLVAAAFLLMLAMTVARFRSSSSRQLLWTLGYAAEHHLSLADTARSFAADRTDELGRRAWSLADQLDRGMSLGEAMAQTRLPASTSSLLSARLGHPTRPLTTWQGPQPEEIPSAATSQTQLFPTLAYLGTIFGLTVLVTTFTMIKIVPTFQTILTDFALTLPPTTFWLIRITDGLARTPTLGLISALTVAVLVVGGYLLLRYLEWIHFEPAGLRWLEKPYHTARVASALGTELGMGYQLHQALRRIERAYPTAHIAHDIRDLRESIERGTPWTVAIAESSLFGPTFQPLLEAAEGAGNVPWAFMQLSDQLVQRTDYRRQLAMQWLTPSLLLLIALPIAFIAISLIIPLIALIANLS
ncbi:MAG: type II secretion system F family protein [Planctomycetota bacterium]